MCRPAPHQSLTAHVLHPRATVPPAAAVRQNEPLWTEAPHCGQRQTGDPSHRRRCRRSQPPLRGSSGGPRLFTFLSIRTVKTSRSLSGSLLSTSPWLNSWTGWLRRAVRFALDRPMSFPLRGWSSAAILDGRPVFTTLGFRDTYVVAYGTVLWRD